MAQNSAGTPISNIASICMARNPGSLYSDNTISLSRDFRYRRKYVLSVIECMTQIQERGGGREGKAF
jgi:hypothetical protein